jgi:hypothetical protein
MSEIFDKFGHMNRWELIDNVMHKLPEWQNPCGSSFPISVRDILEAGGEDAQDIRAIVKEINAMGRTEEILSNAG